MELKKFVNFFFKNQVNSKKMDSFAQLANTSF